MHTTRTNCRRVTNTKAQKSESVAMQKHASDGKILEIDGDIFHVTASCQQMETKNIAILVSRRHWTSCCPLHREEGQNLLVVIFIIKAANWFPVMLRVNFYSFSWSICSRNTTEFANEKMGQSQTGISYRSKQGSSMRRTWQKRSVMVFTANRMNGRKLHLVVFAFLHSFHTAVEGEGFGGRRKGRKRFSCPENACLVGQALIQFKFSTTKRISTKDRNTIISGRKSSIE